MFANSGSVADADGLNRHIEQHRDRGPGQQRKRKMPARIPSLTGRYAGDFESCERKHQKQYRRGKARIARRRGRRVTLRI